MSKIYSVYFYLLIMAGIQDIIAYNRLEKSSEEFKAMNSSLRLLENGVYESKVGLLQLSVLEDQKKILVGYEPLVLSGYDFGERGVRFEDIQSFLCGFKTYTSQDWFGYMYRGVWCMSSVNEANNLPTLLRLSPD